jgi:hypothetical protein
MRPTICVATYKFIGNDKYCGKVEMLVARPKNNLKGGSKELHDHYPFIIVSPKPFNLWHTEDITP